MGLDVRTQCPVCAWRETCAKKHTLKETALHCPDFCRDRSFPAEESGGGVVAEHKRREDVFGA